MKYLFATLGPSSIDPTLLKAMSLSDPTAFRINMSHASIADLKSYIQIIRGASNTPICIDTEGSQIRTSQSAMQTKQVKKEQLISIQSTRSHRSHSNLCAIFFTPVDITKKLFPGDLISIDFDGALIQVVDKDPKGNLIGRVLNSGCIGENKAVSVDRSIALDTITKKDREAIKIGAELGVHYYALSFARSGEDVEAFRKLVPRDSFLITKIECIDGLRNLKEILLASDLGLIDRGDLSREVPLSMIPTMQKHIINTAKSLDRPIVVATNLLESMASKPYPTRAEVHDIKASLDMGGDGLVLAGETAIGSYPVQCLKFARKMLQEHTDGNLETKAVLDSLNLNQYPNAWPDNHEVECVDIRVSEEIALDYSQLRDGVYYPIQKFMNAKEISTVLEQCALPDGTPWTLPIVFPVTPKHLDQLEGNTRARLLDQKNNLIGTINIDSIFKIDFDDFCKKIWGTNERSHPFIKKIADCEGYLLSGSPCEGQETVNRSPFYLSPSQLKQIFTAKQWDTVIGFHTRNVPHVGHEYLHCESLCSTGADGILLSPVIGPKKKGDFTAKAILDGYSAYVTNHPLLKELAVIAPFNNYSRFAGPREAIFTAICRRNMGCTHFIIGRDHTGIGKNYDPTMLNQFLPHKDSLGIEIIQFEEIGWCEQTKKAIPLDKSKTASMKKISGSTIRQNLMAGNALPEGTLANGVEKALKYLLDSNIEIFEP